MEHPGTYADLSLCQTVYDAGTAVAPTFAYRHEQAVAGESCPTGVGSSLSGLAFYNGGNYPAAFNGALFFADYSRKCIWVMYAGADGLPNPSTIEPFIENAFAPVQLKIGPGGDLFYPDFNGGTVHRVTYSSPAGTPVADVDASPTSGTAPLTVAFDGRGSTDPNGDSLTYAWDLDGDGSFDDSTSATPSFTYTIDGDVLVRLRVTDPGGLFGTATVLISVTLGGSVRYVSDLAFTLSANGWGPVERDRSNGGDGAGDGGPIMIGGTTYPKGLGVHAESEVRLDIPIGCTSFAAVVGIDDESGAIGSVTFTVLGGTEVLATSNLLTGADAGQALNVDVGTATELRLVVAGGADIVSDHADWADAQFSCSDGGNAPPTPVIGTPAASFTWHVDETVNFSGSATDAEDGAIPASGLSWTLVLQHCATTGCHAHTVQSWNGVASGSFAGPDHEYPAHLELRLTATDSDGASTMVTRTLQPETVDLTFATSPTGLQLTVGSATAAAPFTRTVIVGSTVGVGAPTPQTIGSAWYDFSTWSDGGARNHDLVAPGAATTYTAAFVAAVPPPAVTGLSAQPTTENTKLSWTAVAGVAGYHVYRASSASGPFSRVNGSALTTPTFTDTSAPPLTSSWYRVTAVAANGIESAPATTIGHRRIQLVGITSTTNNGLNQIQVAAPAGRQVNDLMLATLTIGGAQTITPPAGWTLVRVDTSGSALRQAIYSRFVTASEPSTATFALSSPAAGVGAVALYRGVSTSTPIEAHSGRVNPTSLQVATTPITTLTAHAAVVGAFGAAWHTAVTPPSSMLDQAGGSYQRWKQGASMRIADRVFTAPSSTGTLTATVRRAAVSIGQLVALRPAAP